MIWTDKTSNVSRKLIQQMQLPDSFIKIIKCIYLPLVDIILNYKTHSPLFISINGAQGTGKSTLSCFLTHLIEASTEYNVVDISLDDFYATRQHREQLAKHTHPLLITRGVPGTHDLDLMTSTLSTLLEGKPCHIPRFDKAMDDQLDRSQWTACTKPIDIILFEGWCNHSPIQTPDQLKPPINELEAQEDPEGIWRHYTNEQLKLYHQKIFQHANMNLMLKAPDFEQIYAWRSLQEDKLRQNTANSDQTRIMSDNELKRFIQHYERISRHTLKNLPATADIVIPINSDHSIKEVFNRHEQQDINSMAGDYRS